MNTDNPLRLENITVELYSNETSEDFRVDISTRSNNLVLDRASVIAIVNYLSECLLSQKTSISIDSDAAIPTAEYFLEHESLKLSDSAESLIQFARLHVKAALAKAAEDADMDDDYYASVQEGSYGCIDKDSILEAYPESLIK